MIGAPSADAVDQIPRPIESQATKGNSATPAVLRLRSNSSGLPPTYGTIDAAQCSACHNPPADRDAAFSCSRHRARPLFACPATVARTSGALQLPIAGCEVAATKKVGVRARSLRRLLPSIWALPFGDITCVPKTGPPVPRC